MPEILNFQMLHAYKMRVIRDGDYEYIGYAHLGTATSAPAWAIMRSTYSADALVATEWADGDHLLDNVWDNYASLAYK